MSNLLDDIRNQRRDYEGPELTKDIAPENPMVLFGAWLSYAHDKDVFEPLAMNLCTVDASGQPSSRIVLLRSLEEDGFMFFTNYESRKGKAIAENPKASLTFFWETLMRQVRIEGTLQKATREESEAYWDTRPRGSQIGAWASAQSEVIESRKDLEEATAKVEAKYEGKPVPCPPFWGGYKMIPHQIEFWQGRENRLHDRIRYHQENNEWKIERLAP